MLAMLAMAVLLAGEVAHESADRMAGHRTAAVRLGRDRAASLIRLLFLATFAIPIYLVAYRGVSWLAGAAAGIPIAAFADWSLHRQRRGDAKMAWNATLITFAVTGLGLAIGAILG